MPSFPCYIKYSLAHHEPHKVKMKKGVFIFKHPRPNYPVWCILCQDATFKEIFTEELLEFL